VTHTHQISVNYNDWKMLSSGIWLLLYHNLNSMHRVVQNDWFFMIFKQKKHHNNACSKYTVSQKIGHL